MPYPRIRDYDRRMFFGAGQIDRDEAVLNRGSSEERGYLFITSSQELKPLWCNNCAWSESDRKYGNTGRSDVHD